MLSRLNKLAPHPGIEVVVISRPTAYGEYGPHSFVETEDELRGAVLAM